MKKPSILGLMIAVFITTLSIFSDLRATSLYPTGPDSVKGIVDVEFDVAIRVDDVIGLFGASFELNFDKTYLNAIGESAESFLGGDVVFISQHDNLNGTVGIGITKKAGQNASNGSGALANIRFKLIKSVGQDTLLSFTLSSVSANDSLGNPIGLTANPDSILVFYPYALSVSETSWTARAEGGNSPQIVVTNSRSGEAIEYAIDGQTGWLSASSIGGSTPGAFIFTVESNRTGSARTDTVTIAATSPSGVLGSPRRVLVTQQPTPPALSLSDTAWAAPARGGVSSEVHVVNSGSAVTISYAVSENADWLSVSAVYGITPGSFTITAESNPDGMVRTDTVIVSALSPSGVSNFQQKVLVTQQPPPLPAILRPLCPDSIPGTLNTEFDVTVEVANAVDLFGIGFQLNFSKERLNALSGAPEPFLGDSILFLSNIDNANGKIGIGLTKKAGQSGADGAGSLATIRFKVIRNALRDTTVNFIFTGLNANDSTMTPVVLHADSGSTRLKALNVGIDHAGSSQPKKFYLFQNAPNPFNPTTTIRYSIPKSGDVTLEVFDGLGRLIATLFKGHREAGEHQEPFDSHGLSSGTYYCRLEAGGSIMTRKMMLVR